MPLAGILAQSPRDYLTVWALLGTWTCALVWPTPDEAKWPKACYPCNVQLRERKPYLTLKVHCAPSCAAQSGAFFQCHGIGPVAQAPTARFYPTGGWTSERPQQTSLSTYKLPNNGQRAPPPLLSCLTAGKYGADLNPGLPSDHLPPPRSIRTQHVPNVRGARNED